MQSLYFLFGAWFQIRSPNLLDHVLDFGGIGFRNFSLWLISINHLLTLGQQSFRPTITKARL